MPLCRMLSGNGRCSLRISRTKNTNRLGTKGAGACPGGGRRAHFGGEMFPWREIAAAWAQKGAGACPGGGRRAHSGEEMFPVKEIAVA